MIWIVSSVPDGEIWKNWKFDRCDGGIWILGDCKFALISWDLTWVELGISWRKTRYHEIVIHWDNRDSGNVVISYKSDDIWRDFGAGLWNRFNLDKSTCFITISQVVLVRANPCSVIGKNHSASVASEFGDVPWRIHTFSSQNLFWVSCLHIQSGQFLHFFR